MSEERVSFTEEVLGACRELGRARVVLRNPVGIAEAFADLEALELRDGWAHLCEGAAHVHAQVEAIAGVRFVGTDDAACTCAGPAVWFASRSGSPLLMFVLDQTRGVEQLEQVRAFDTLRARFGDARALVSSGGIPELATMS